MLLAGPAPACQTAGVPPAQPRFALDRTLGRLARWLRLLGFDATLRPEIPAEALLPLAAREGRVVLLRTRLPERVRVAAGLRVLRLTQGDVRGQLQEIATLLPEVVEIDSGRMPRCVTCNRPLRPRRGQSAGGCGVCRRKFEAGPQIVRFHASVRALAREIAAGGPPVALGGGGPTSPASDNGEA